MVNIAVVPLSISSVNKSSTDIFHLSIPHFNVKLSLVKTVCRIYSCVMRHLGYECCCLRLSSMTLGNMFGSCIQR